MSRGNRGTKQAVGTVERNESREPWIALFFFFLRVSLRVIRTRLVWW
jgi:hypothetical protein